MNVFILEDSDERIKWFKTTWARYAHLVVCTNYYHAVQEFQKFDFSLILLDHDLGWSGLLGSDDIKNSGAHFAEWLSCNYGHISHVPVIIHSHNSMGAQKMVDHLDKGGFKSEVIPFSALRIEWERGTLSFLGHYKYDVPDWKDCGNFEVIR